MGDQDMAFRKRQGRMALSLCDVQRDPIANRALEELMHHYTVAEEKSGLALTKKAGNMKLFFYDLDDLHQWDFLHNQEMVKEIWSEIDRLDRGISATRSARGQSSSAA